MGFNYAHAMFAFIPKELYATFGESEQSVVFADAHIVCGVDASAALSDDNITGFYDFAGIFFDAQSLSIRISTVGG